MALSSRPSSIRWRSASPTSELSLTGSLEDAQERKADALIARANLSKHHRLLDVGFGWGGISIRWAALRKSLPGCVANHAPERLSSV